MAHVLVCCPPRAPPGPRGHRGEGVPRDRAQGFTQVCGKINADSPSHGKAGRDASRPSLGHVPSLGLWVLRFWVRLDTFASTSSSRHFCNFFTVQILIYTSVQKKDGCYFCFYFLVIFVDLFYENFQVSLSPSLRALRSRRFGLDAFLPPSPPSDGLS